MLRPFNSICEFRQKKPGVKGSALYSNDPALNEVKSDLSELVVWLQEIFQNYKNINFKFKQSSGTTFFPSVLHVSVLPPAQQVSNGIYVVICFDVKGRGALIGCAESKTNPQGLDTVLRSKNKNLLIDVNGLSEKTKYNDVFVNPKEFFYGEADAKSIEAHIKESLDLCLYHLKMVAPTLLDVHMRSLVNANSEFDFNPENLNEAKERIARFISYRRGQKKFRDELLAAYGGKCALTSCNVVETLEAAHIVPYRGEETNKLINGILLRADIHILFDLGLITISSDTYTILISRQLYNSMYHNYENKKINLPSNQAHYPNKKALAYHNGTFRL